LRKLRLAGLNAVSTYVEWSQHEPSPGRFEFSGELDLQYFIQLAQEEDLLVLLRPGPYICAERDMGGLPPWLLTVKPDIYLRTNDTTYMEYVERYLTYLMTSVQTQLYGNGGPIIMVQIENEYGSYEACDLDYTIWLRDIVSSIVGDTAVLYTTDGAASSYLKCGKVDGVYATVDFGASTDVDTAFLAQRNYEPSGPLINSEFYTGWITHWGEIFQRVDTDAVVNTLVEMLERNASINFFMFYGGTNFGFSAGANYGNNYQPQLTSYDYDAPISEAGDPTSKYFAIREVVGRYLPLLNVAVPEPQPKGDYGTIILSPVMPLLDQRSRQTLGKEPIRSQFPLTFEQLGQRYGFMLYETIVAYSVPDPALFSIPNIGDRAIVLLDDVPKGILSRSKKITSIYLSVFEGTKIQVLVENEGRINYGSLINDFKGLVSTATLGGEVLEDWIITGFPLNDISRLYVSNNDSYTFSTPGFFHGTFTLPESYSEPLDTFLDPTGWGKGVAFINGFNLGRYWPITGPQVTLYVPGCHLKPYPAVNELILLELEKANSPQYYISFVPEPVLDKLPPGDK
jgi:beta-galactosidase